MSRESFLPLQLFLVLDEGGQTFFDDITIARSHRDAMRKSGIDAHIYPVKSQVSVIDLLNAASRNRVALGKEIV